MKGEFFLISGIVLVVILFLVKSSLDLIQIIERKKDFEVSIEKEEFMNIKEQIERTIEYSYNKNESEKIENFIYYVRGRVKKRLIELNGIAIEASYGNVSPGINTNLNITIQNFIGKTILSLNLSFNGSNQSFSNFADNSSLHTNFTFNTYSDINLTLILSYSTFEESKEYEIAIPIEIGKSKLTAFFDLRMEGKSKNKDEFSKIVEIR